MERRDRKLNKWIFDIFKVVNRKDKIAEQRDDKWNLLYHEEMSLQITGGKNCRDVGC